MKYTEALTQEVTQGYCWCEVADEPVVVSKARPVKPGNGVEDKTRLTIGNEFNGVHPGQKLGGMVKGGSIL